MKFSYKEMEDMLAPLCLEENQTANIHHCKQGHGNNRCYVTNKGDMTLFYCHHCGGSGGVKNRLARVKRALSPSSTALPRGFNLPHDVEKDVSKWPVEARVWLIQGKIEGHVAATRGLCYSPRLNRVCIPVVFAGEYMGYTARRIGDEGPKYLARVKDKEGFLYVVHKVDNNNIVLVEDIMSCIRLSNLGYNCVALQGTHLTSRMLNYITSHYDNFSVWLDNDNPQVKMQQAKLKSELSLFGSVRLIKTEVDPKNLNDVEIKDTLT
jgi:hypothetical protein